MQYFFIELNGHWVNYFCASKSTKTTSNAKKCLDIRVLVFDIFQAYQYYLFLAKNRAAMTIFSEFLTSTRKTLGSKFFQVLKFRKKTKTELFTLFLIAYTLMRSAINICTKNA